MADNYLEKHYEEYEAKKAAWEKAKKMGKYKPKKTQKKDLNQQRDEQKLEAL